VCVYLCPVTVMCWASCLVLKLPWAEAALQTESAWGCALQACSRWIEYFSCSVLVAWLQGVDYLKYDNCNGQGVPVKVR